MALASLLAFFLLSHLSLLYSAEPSCPKSVNCGNLDPFPFPFYNSTYPQCGFCKLSCDERLATVDLGEKGRLYEVKHFLQPDTIRVLDYELQHFIERESCESFGNITIPSSPSISYTIFGNMTLFMTLFKCSSSSTQTDDYFKDYYSYKECADHHLYYKFPNVYVPFPPDLPVNCSVIQQPLSPAGLSNTAIIPPQLFTLLSAEFSVQLHVSDDCVHCRSKGGQCRNEDQHFHCIYDKGRRNWTVILATVIPGTFIIVMCLVFFIVWRLNKWSYFTSFFSPRKSSSDLEDGSVYFGVPVFSYKELEEATHNFDPFKELGDGGFGIVYHGKLRDGREVAVKRMYENNYKRVEQFMNEIEILTCLRHRNLVQLYGSTSRRSRELLLVYEYIPNGTVADHLHGDRAETGSLTWPIRMNIAIETASALAYLHASDIVHRDVKTNNILLDNNFCVKVADFGLSRLFPTDVTHVSTAPQGTPGYVDPEYHQCYQLTYESDVYSFGVVLIELISSLPAVDISRHRHEINLANLAINRIQRCSFNELIDPSLGFASDSTVERMTTSVAELAFRCLQLEKEMRPAMDEVLEALKEIQGDDNAGGLKNVQPPPSPESDMVVLLKNNKLPASPNCVSDKWASSRSTTPSASG